MGYIDFYIFIEHLILQSFLSFSVWKNSHVFSSFIQNIKLNF